MLFDINGNALEPLISGGIVGDGVTDDTNALQTLINVGGGVRLPTGLKIKITEPIEIDTETLDFFDGGNSTFIASGNFNAFEISGSAVSPCTGDPVGKDDLVKKEAGFVFQNCKITSSAQTGVGIYMSNTYKARIENCYVYYTNVSLQIANVHRDMIISNCAFYAFQQYGIYFDSTSDVHQCNINGNTIQQGTYGIYFNDPAQIANIQITGNDIEFGYYPTSNYTSQRGLYAYSGNTKSGQFSEIEICGNTIQGHAKSTNIIEFVGGTNRYIEHTSIVGNHISNTTGGNIILLTKVSGFTCCGNTFKDGGYVYAITNCQYVAITGEAATNVTGISTQSGTNTGVVVDNNTAG